MRVRLSRRWSTGLLAVAGLVLALGACGDPAAPVPGDPPALASPSAPSSTPSTVAPASDGTGSDGLTVRYLGDDGSVKTVRVEDFPR